MAIDVSDSSTWPKHPYLGVKRKSDQQRCTIGVQPGGTWPNRVWFLPVEQVRELHKNGQLPSCDVNEFDRAMLAVDYEAEEIISIESLENTPGGLAQIDKMQWDEHVGGVKRSNTPPDFTKFKFSPHVTPMNTEPEPTFWRWLLSKIGLS